MELLIPGLILVALMVWASTKIKDKAAAAFEPEAIETDEFVIVKPGGFLHVVNDDSGLVFRAYSKEYGKNELNGDRQATIELSSHREADIEQVLAGIKGDAILSDIQSYLDAGEPATTFLLDETNQDPRRVRHYKLVSRGANVFELCFAVLDRYQDEFANEIEQTLTNFRAR